MKVLGIALVLLVALEHLYFLYLEMFLWTRPKGLRIFGNTAEKAEASKVLAANQGLYNGFLAAGLLWGLVYPGVAGVHVQIFPCLRDRRRDLWRPDGEAQHPLPAGRAGLAGAAGFAGRVGGPAGFPTELNLARESPCWMQ